MLFKYSKDICEAFPYPSSWKHYSADHSALGLKPPVTATQLCPSLKSLCALITITVSVFHLPWASLVAQLVKNLLAIRETWVQSLAWEDPWRRERLPTPVFCPGEFHGLYRPWGRKESDTTEWLSLSLSFRNLPYQSTIHLSAEACVISVCILCSRNCCLTDSRCMVQILLNSPVNI